MPKWAKVVFGLWIGTWTTCWGLLMAAANVEQETAFKALGTWWTWIESVLGQNAKLWFTAFCVVMVIVPIILAVVWFRHMKKPPDGEMPEAILPQSPRPPLPSGVRVGPGASIGNLRMRGNKGIGVDMVNNEGRIDEAAFEDNEVRSNDEEPQK